MRKIKVLVNMFLALFVSLVLIFTIVVTNGVEYKTVQNVDNILGHVKEMSKAPHSLINEASRNEVQKYITDTLETYGLVLQDDVTQSSYLVQEKTIDIIDSKVGRENVSQSFNIKNINAFIPSSEETSNTILFMAHYDSVPMGTGASDDLVSVGVMLETINYYLNNSHVKLKNNLLFSFVDGEEYSLYGSELFMNEFTGFNNILDSVSLAVNLESRGTKGTLIMFETSKNNYEAMKLFAKINTNVFTSSIANLVYASMPNGTDYSNLKEAFQGFNFANLGGGEDYHTQNDNFTNLGKSYLTQQANIVDNIIKGSNDYDLSKLNNATTDAIFFTYFNQTIVYSNTAAIILAIILLILSISLIIGLVIKKNASIKLLLQGLAIVLINLAISGIVGFGLYYLLSLIAVLTGTINIHQLGQITYSNTLMIALLFIFTIGITFFTNRVVARFISVESKFIRRSHAFLMALLGMILSFILPEVSYLIVIPGILLLCNEVIKTYVKHNYLTEMLVYGLMIPIFIPVIFLASFALGTTYTYILMFLMTLYSLPLIVSLLPAKTTKKRSFANIINYQVLGYSFLLLMMIVMIKPDISKNLAGKQNIPILCVDDAIVLEISEDQKLLKIGDLNAYNTLKKYYPDFQYDKLSNSFQKKTTNLFTTTEFTNIVRTGQDINVDVNSISGYVDLIVLALEIESYQVVYESGHTKTVIMKEANQVIRLVSNAKISIVLKPGITNSSIEVIDFIENCRDLLKIEDFKIIKDVENVKYNVIKKYKI